MSYIDFRFMQQIDARPQPATLTGDLWRNKDAHRVQVRLGHVKIMAVLVTLKRWIENRDHNTRGLYSIDYHPHSHCFEVYFTDADTAYWFKNRWGNAV